MNPRPFRIALTLCTLVATGSRVASADILTLRADARAGAAMGTGMFGELKDESFFDGRGSAGYGVVAGAEVFFVDLWVEHNQYLSSEGVSGTWTQFMTGFDVELDMGEQKSVSFDDDGREVGGYSSWFTELGIGFGFGVGTGQQVEPPLNNAQVTDKGFLVEARGMVAYRLTEMLAVGVTVPLQFGYFTKSDADRFANQIDNHYAAFGGQAMLTLRASFNVK